MSRPRLHETLYEFLENKSTDVSVLFEHQDFREFSEKFNLQIPASDLSLAFTHKTFSHEFDVPHQEQLEFLGDAVLQFVLTDELYRRFPQEKEGRLSKLRSAIVNEKSLAAMGQRLNLGDLIIVGKGEYKKRLFEQDTVLADTFEALLAQVYRHHGLDFTKTLFLSWLNEFIPDAFASDFLDHFDAKSKLQEKSLAKYKKLPKYSSEPRGEEFEVTLHINEEVAARGIFPSKKKGERQLAEEVLKKGII